MITLKPLKHLGLLSILLALAIVRPITAQPNFEPNEAPVFNGHLLPPTESSASASHPKSNANGAALVRVEWLLDLDPSNSKAWMMKGQLLADAQQWPAAYEAFTQAMETHNGSLHTLGQLYMQRAQAALAQGHASLAITDLEYLVTMLAPDWREAHSLLLSTLNAANDHDGLLMEIERLQMLGITWEVKLAEQASRY